MNYRAGGMESVDLVFLLSFVTSVFLLTPLLPSLNTQMGKGVKSEKKKF